MRRSSAGWWVLAVVLPGCGGEVFIEQMQLSAMTSGVCTIPSTSSAPHIDQGTFDLALGESYSVLPLFQNTISATVQVLGVVVQLREGSPDGPLIGSAFTVYSTITIPAADDGPGRRAGTIEVIPPQVAAVLQSAVCSINPSTPRTAACPVPSYSSANRRLIVTLTAFGETASGSEVETPPFTFPVVVCCGCLITFPTEARAPVSEHRSPNCNFGMASPGPASCRLGQDLPVDCRLCSGTTPFCQPPGFATDPTAPACAP